MEKFKQFKFHITRTRLQSVEIIISGTDAEDAEATLASLLDEAYDSDGLTKVLGAPVKWSDGEDEGELECDLIEED